MEMNYVERCDEYCRLPQEAPAELRRAPAAPPHPPRGWPSRGELRFEATIWLLYSV